MKLDARQFLSDMASAYNDRDPVLLRSYFALEDPRFCLFEEFTGELIYGWEYAQILSSVAEATGTMSFETLDSCRYGDHVLVHAIQRIEDRSGEGQSEVSIVRATLFLSLQGGTPRVLTGHFSSMMLCFPKRETVMRWPKMGEGST